MEEYGSQFSPYTCNGQQDLGTVNIQLTTKFRPDNHRLAVTGALSSVPDN